VVLRIFLRSGFSSDIDLEKQEGCMASFPGKQQIFPGTYNTYSLSCSQESTLQKFKLLHRPY